MIGVSDATEQRLRLHGPIVLGGGELEQCTVGIRSHGDPSAPAVVVLGGISAGRRVAAAPGETEPGWWEEFVGAGRAVDTDRLHVVGFDWLGGRGWTSGPANSAAADGPVDVTLDGPAVSAASGDRFPAISTRDQARVFLAALRQHGVEEVAAVVGSSYGGMVGLAMAEEAPERIGQLVVISAAERSHPMATGLRALQRQVIALAQGAGRETEGLAIARGIAMTTYRTAREFDERFDSPEAVCGYLTSRGQRFAEEWPAASYLCLSESLDRHWVEPSGLTTPITLVGVTSDTLVPPWQIRSLARRYAGPVTLHWLASRYGHDAFLKETTALGRLLRGALYKVNCQ